LKRLAVSDHFKKQLKKLSPQDRQKTVTVLKEFLRALNERKIPVGFGFKKINGDKYELRVDIRIRIAMKADGDTLVCHVIGNHEAIRKYLRNYRNK